MAMHKTDRCPRCGYQLPGKELLRCPRCNMSLVAKCLDCTGCSPSAWDREDKTCPPDTDTEK